AAWVEAAAVTRAVPALFERVPLHDATEVRACGRALVIRVRLYQIAIDGDLAQTLSHHRALAGRDLALLSHLAGRDPVGVFRDGVGVLGDEISIQRLPRRVVDFRPRIVATHDQIGDENAGET